MFTSIILISNKYIYNFIIYCLLNQSSSYLKICILGINQNGAKSRVETQIKLCLQLVTEKGEKVTCWSHLQLPECMVAKEKFKIKNSKNPSEYSSNISRDQILNLEASVVCASDTTRKVLTCVGCVQREVK